MATACSWAAAPILHQVAVLGGGAGGAEAAFHHEGRPRDTPVIHGIDLATGAIRFAHMVAVPPGALESSEPCVVHHRDEVWFGAAIAELLAARRIDPEELVGDTAYKMVWPLAPRGDAPSGRRPPVPVPPPDARAASGEGERRP
jgi:hypothetical protein